MLNVFEMTVIEGCEPFTRFSDDVFKEKHLDQAIIGVTVNLLIDTASVLFFSNQSST